ncbi:MULTISPECIES: sugar phosphate nucleotidyltransferase [Nocardia]|uniref:sugar phosphate nucleotidyltransferase n=1 Tax=Nocardia TaxID=1817 RepID=UPI002453C9E7|nr:MULTISPECIES: sugar phosphate nucleotidyltransferase [Nocardia]
MTIVVGNPEFQAQTFALRDNCGRLARAVVENFDDIAAVTGKPVTHLVDLLAVSGARFHYAINEKVAFESAVGASMSGRRVCVVMKHNGLGCVADSLANAALHTVGAALVVIVGDDPDATSSTSAVDSRLLAEAVQVPMLEPTLSSDCAEIIATAVDTAERNHVPVLIRVTPQLHAACDGMPDAIIDLTHVSGRKIERHSRDHVAHSLTKLGRIQRHRLTTLPGVRATSDGTSSVISCDGRGSRAVIASGAAAQLVPSGGGCLMSVRRTWPLSSSITEFARAHDEVLAEKFHEKPDLPTARGYLESGMYFWNTAIMAWAPKVFITAARAHASRLAAQVTSALHPDGSIDAVRWQDTEVVAVEPAVIEPAAAQRGVSVVPADFDWTDVGTWATVAGGLPSSEQDVITLDCRPPVVYADRRQARRYAVVGLDDLIVVECDDVVLITDKYHAADVKRLVADLPRQNGTDLL